MIPILRHFAGLSTAFALGACAQHQYDSYEKRCVENGSTAGNKPAEINTTLTMELFVADLPKSVRFYRDVLGFEAPDLAGISYTPINRGSVAIGLCPKQHLSSGHYFNRRGLSRGNSGVGVEIGLEVEDVEGLFRHVKEVAPDAVTENLTEQPWGLSDFRVADPDGYYIRISECNG